MRAERSAVLSGESAWDRAGHATEAHLLCRGPLVAWANAAALALLRAERGDGLIGRPLVELGADAVQRSALADWLGTLGGGSAAFPTEVCLRRGDGQSQWVQVLGTSLMHDDQVSTEVVLRGVSSQRPRESARLLAERLGASGALAAGVAHAINNPLAYVLINLDFVNGLLEEVPRLDQKELDEVREAMAEAREGARQMSRIMQSLKVFSPYTEDSAKSADLREVIESVLDLAHGAVRQRARLSTDLQAIPPVRGRAAALGQLVLGLVLEQIRALGAAGIRDGEVRLTTRFEAGAVVLEVACSGGEAVIDPDSSQPGSRANERRSAGPDLSLCRALAAEAGGVLVALWTEDSGGSIRAHLAPLQPAHVAAGI